MPIICIFKSTVNIHNFDKGFGIEIYAEPIFRHHCDDSEGNGMLSYIIYFVQKGDTLWNIAKRYKTTVEDILNDNDIPDPDNINVGQKIRLVK